MNLPEQVIKAMQSQQPTQLALGWIRYEKLRRLSPREYGELCNKNMTLAIPFDDLVDRMDLKTVN